MNLPIEFRTQRVYIVEDEESVRESLSDLLESAGVPTTTYPSAEAFFEGVPANPAGCLLLDVRLPGMSGMELQQRLGRSDFQLPIIIMTGHGDVSMVRTALKAGAVDFLPKPFQDRELLEAVENAFALDVARRTAANVERNILSRVGTLTHREREVMNLVTAGLTNVEIADRLDIRLVTVKMHRGQVMEKMQAESLAELVKMSERLCVSQIEGLGA